MRGYRLGRAGTVRNESSLGISWRGLDGELLVRGGVVDG